VSGPEGTPNGVDRLAQIAERKSFYDEDGEWVYLSADERDALVEIAKAARAWTVAESSDDYSAALRELRRVVARLDSGTAKDLGTSIETSEEREQRIKERADEARPHVSMTPGMAETLRKARNE
jgi:hypothetical protein